MRKRNYSFVSEWVIAAPRTKVWQVLTATPFSWTEWWPQLTELQTLSVAEHYVGTHFTCVWRASGYRLLCDFTITDASYPTTISFQSAGDLAGTAIWAFSQIGDSTQIKIKWEVVTNKWWMNLLSPLLQAIFKRNHNLLMNSGERGLQAFLSADGPQP